MPGPVSLRFVLVRPTNALNIGAAARAMSNFGLDDLVAVEPDAPRWRLAQSALYGAPLLQKANQCPLDEAIAGANLVLGTASMHDRADTKTLLTLPALKKFLDRRLENGGRVAVLFGGEKNGLSNDDLSRCHAILKIPTTPAAPSMNLGQAVALVAYEAQRLNLEKTIKEPDQTLIDAKQLKVLVETAMRAMEKARYNTHMKEDGRRRKAANNFARWKMSRGDAAWLNGLLSRLSGSAQE